jgi:type IV pilus assembly protein PilB
MNGLRITEAELRTFLVQQLEVIDDQEFDRARSMAGRFKIPLERAVVERNHIPMRFLMERLAEAWGVDFADLKPGDVHAPALRLLREDYARARTVMPFGTEGGRLQLAMADPRDRRTIAEVEQTVGMPVAPVLAPEPAIRRAHLLYHADVREMLRRTALEASSVGPAMTTADDRSAGDLLQRVFEYAAVAQASDIHVEPYEFELLIRCRVDGVLQEVLSLPAAMTTPLVARIKVLAGLRIDDRRTPQDGRFDVDLNGYRLDMRVSTLPTHWGEKAVMRVQSKDSVLVDLEDLGLSADDYKTVLRNVMRPWGMILITGPTGSGKTTSLYSMLSRVGAERQNVVNISTVEDPVEYPLARVNQMPVNPAAGVEFATGLRALLRQDPDIIMVGEIRDRETAQIAVRCALVGRLLLSTLHTNDSTGAVPRLLDMEVEPFLVASTLSLIVAQRLVRRICVTCRVSVTADERVLGMLRNRPDFERITEVLRQRGALGRGADPWAGVRFFKGQGCPQCNGSGFRGRIGVFELYEIDADARTRIMERASAAALREAALARGMTTMFQDGLTKALLGDTTMDEVFRVAL